MRVGPVFALLVLIATQGCSSAPPIILNFSQMVGSNYVSFVQIPQTSMMPNASEIMKGWVQAVRATVASNIAAGV